MTDGFKAVFARLEVIEAKLGITYQNDLKYPSPHNPAHSRIYRGLPPASMVVQANEHLKKIKKPAKEVK